MDSWTVKEKMGLPVWDGDYVVGIEHKFPGDTLTREELETARQSPEEIEMLVSNNCEEAE